MVEKRLMRTPAGRPERKATSASPCVTTSKTPPTELLGPDNNVAGNLFSSTLDTRFGRAQRSFVDVTAFTPRPELWIRLRYRDGLLFVDVSLGPSTPQP